MYFSFSLLSFAICTSSLFGKFDWIALTLMMIMTIFYSTDFQPAAKIALGNTCRGIDAKTDLVGAAFKFWPKFRSGCDLKEKIKDCFAASQRSLHQNVLCVHKMRCMYHAWHFLLICLMLYRAIQGNTYLYIHAMMRV